MKGLTGRLSDDIQRFLLFGSALRLLQEPRLLYGNPHMVSDRFQDPYLIRLELSWGSASKLDNSKNFSFGAHGDYDGGLDPFALEGAQAVPFRDILNDHRSFQSHDAIEEVPCGCVSSSLIYLMCPHLFRIRETLAGHRLKGSRRRI